MIPLHRYTENTISIPVLRNQQISKSNKNVYVFYNTNYY